MKTFIISIFIFLGFYDLPIAYSQNFQSDSSKALIYLMRSTGFQGSATPYVAFIDSNMVCKLNNNKYSIHQVIPGQHKFYAQFNGKTIKDNIEPISLNVEAGKVYYLGMVVVYGKLINKLSFYELSEYAAKVSLENLEEDPNCTR